MMLQFLMRILLGLGFFFGTLMLILIPVMFLYGNGDPNVTGWLAVRRWALAEDFDQIVPGLAWIVFIALCLIGGYALRPIVRRREPRAAGQCERCGYDLRGTPGGAAACPECGGGV